MTPADLVLMATRDDDALGDECTTASEPVAVEPEPTHAELHARLKLSVELVKLERRVEEQRCTINRILTRFTVEGRPIPMEGITT